MTEFVKTIVTNFISVDFRQFRFFSHPHTYLVGVKKHASFDKFLSQILQPNWQEERVGGYEGRKGMIF